MTMTCSTSSDVFRCRTKWELWRQLLANLPRGRAWQTHEDTPTTTIAGDDTAEMPHFQIGHTGLGEEARGVRLTIMEQWWAAYAEVLEFLHQRACALVNEMFCDSVDEMREEWWKDYGFPDDCEPWTNLCAKVAAQGGATCAYLAALAASRGWVLTCSDCTSSTGAGCVRAGHAVSCGCEANTIYVDVNLTNYIAPVSREAVAGSARAGHSVSGPCPPVAVPLQCLIERWKPAHVKAVYTYIGV